METENTFLSGQVCPFDTLAVSALRERAGVHIYWLGKEEDDAHEVDCDQLQRPAPGTSP